MNHNNDTQMYDADQQRTILSIARQAVGAALGRERLDPEAFDEPFLRASRGCFVTLHGEHDQLRGCIGTFDSTRPLITNLIEMAGAATRDPRFVNEPVTLDQLPQLKIEVSVLSPMQKMDDPQDLRLGVDGVYLVDQVMGQPRSGCFLPQVAPEQGWDARQTLEFCCTHKMGLPPDAWRDSPTMQCYRFQAQVISE
jgi:AmmeMemoRadiSam system protein A